MRVVILEDNLFWSVRLAKSVTALGHEAHVVAHLDDPAPPAEVAIVNLGSPSFENGAVVARLRAAGAYVIGHAGHKEGDVLDGGRAAGCDRVASNSEVTHRLADLLDEAVRAGASGKLAADAEGLP